MPKPGMNVNVPNPSIDVGQDLRDVMSVGSGSKQTAATCQLSSDPNRMLPRSQEAGPSGKALVERDDVMPDQTSNYSASQRVNDTMRKKMYSNG